MNNAINKPKNTCVSRVDSGYNTRECSLTAEEIELAPNFGLTKKYLTIDEVSKFLQVPKSWIYERTRKNLIPHKRIGKYLRFNITDIESWINGSFKIKESKKHRL